MLGVDELHKKSISELEALYRQARASWESYKKSVLKPGSKFREEERAHLEALFDYVGLISEVLREKKGTN